MNLEFVHGRVVVVLKGRDAGYWCVVTGMCPKTGRPFVADGVRHPVDKPKRKNPRHLQKTGRFLNEVAFLLSQGKKLDNGRVAALLSEVRSEGGFREMSEEVK